jgi:tRNA/rRNA methyltransferase
MAPTDPNTAPWVILVRPQGPINVGLIARAVVNMGGAGLRLVDPKIAITEHEDAQTYACHARDLLAHARIYGSLQAARADLPYALATTRRNPRLTLPWVDPQEAHGRARAYGSQMALVFGCEAHGLNAHELQQCDGVLDLAPGGAHGSLNLSHAVAIALWAVTRPPALNAVAPATHPHALPLPFSMREHLYQLWQQTLDLSGYLDRMRQDRFLPRLWRLVRDLPLTTADGRLLAGMLTHLVDTWPHQTPPASKRSGRLR